MRPGGPVDAAGQNGDGWAVSDEGAAVRGLVHPVGEAADDGVARGRELATQLGGLLHPVIRRGARPDHGHSIGSKLG